ncbi:MAG: 2OG-Fe(II) oxygenase [Hyphomonadaceae bacterium]|nr:2OG-Fe(II) oxygenase [Hyphomonadaceae bacterium]
MSESIAVRPLRFGEAMGHDQVPSNRNPKFTLGSIAGRYVLICVAFDLADPATSAALTALAATPFDESRRFAALFCADAAMDRDPLVRALGETCLIVPDPKREAIRKLGLADEGQTPKGRWLLLDPTLRVLGAWPHEQASKALALFNAAPEPAAHAGVPLHAPVLIAPRVFEPGFCQQLIAYYETRGGRPSGTTHENQHGKTYVALNQSFKRRTDCDIEDASLREAAMQRIYWRLAPEIERAFAFKSTRMERYIVACYDSESGGFFKPHRDNTTKGTAHRRFAVTINLNADEYEGGDLRFPEFGPRTYRAPTGGAVVFSCSLLHEATPVTKGKRYAFLPFLYDEAAAQVRAANNQFLDESVGAYRG